MGVFKNNPEEWRRLDYRILLNGWISLYYQQAVLKKDIDWFEKNNFEIIDFDCTNWTEIKIIHKDISDHLGFPQYYGESFDALNDCLSDFDISSSGLLIIFRHFQFVEKKVANILLDIFANNSRRHILFGEKLLTLVQVDNPDYEIESVGSCPISWNESEWLNSKRDS
ncbi:MAG: barstar family protein [Chitinophagaceae bacterium]|nr:barstar family protein [Chitinophagaceae bacterium]